MLRTSHAHTGMRRLARRLSCASNGPLARARAMERVMNAPPDAGTKSPFKNEE
jgi:hypothetical protein